MLAVDLNSIGHVNLGRGAGGGEGGKGGGRVNSLCLRMNSIMAGDE